MTPEDLIDKSFGLLVVKGISYRREHWSRTEYFCDCTCGNVCEKNGATLFREGNEAKCRSCGGRGGGKEAEYIPTPEEIRAECEEIRKGWSGREKLSRYRREPDWVPPVGRVRLGLSERPD